MADRRAISTDQRALAYIPLNAVTTNMTPQMEGHRRWTSNGAFAFEPTEHNISLLRGAYPDIEIDDRRSKFIEGPVSSQQLEAAALYTPKITNLQQQQVAFDLSKDAECFALFMEAGTGKSKVGVDRAAYLFLKGEITAVIVLAPRGVHLQWVEEAVPTYLPDSIPAVMYAWQKKPLPDWMMYTDRLSWFAMNIDAIKTPDGMRELQRFIRAHKGKVLIICDESHKFANASSKRTKTLYKLRDIVRYRMLMSGTPISKRLSDEWAQFKFLREDIIGIKYVSAFRAQFCVMGGYENRKVVAHRNVEEFQRRVNPYIYRVLKKDCLDLPEKIYDRWVFEMTAKQRAYYDELKKTHMAKIKEAKDQGIQDLTSVSSAALLVLRLQQITSGFLPMDDGSVVEFDNPRLEALQALLDVRQENKVIIWARFQRDIEIIQRAFPDDSITYYGKTKSRDRDAAKEAFIEGPKRFFLSNPEVGGTGLDGLQKVCQLAIYYSNSYKAIERWQSEDRIHRIGSIGAEYIDLICKKSVDQGILTVLRRNKEFAALVLGDYREMLDDGADDLDDGVIEEVKQIVSEPVKLAAGATRSMFDRGEAKNKTARLIKGIGAKR